MQTLWLPTRLTIKAGNIAPDATSVASLELIFDSSNKPYNTWWIYFRNIPISSNTQPQINSVVEPSSTLFRGNEINVAPDVKKISSNEWEVILPASLQQLDTANFADPIYVRQGQTIIVSATGKLNGSSSETPNDGAYKVVGADGWYSNPSFNRGRRSPLPPNAPFMALAMRIGNGRLPVDDGRWMLIGSQKRVVAAQNGFLHFTVNDMNDPTGQSDWWSNNEGGLKVRVRVQ
jgi:hypothetical protein